jgi:hypothetical protein
MELNKVVPEVAVTFKWCFMDALLNVIAASEVINILPLGLARSQRYHTAGVKQRKPLGTTATCEGKFMLN